MQCNADSVPIIYRPQYTKLAKGYLPVQELGQDCTAQAKFFVFSGEG